MDADGNALGYRQAGFGIAGSSTVNGPQYAFGVRAGQLEVASGVIMIDGTQVSFGGGDEAWVNAAHSGGKFIDVGPFPRTVSVVLNFFAEPGARIISPTIFIMGAKR